MDFKLVWTPLARDDLREIASYIARDNPAAALRVGERILRSVEPLKTMPQLGGNASLRYSRWFVSLEL